MQASSKVPQKSIVFTGGGTSGHVTSNLALIPYFLAEGWHVAYLGSYHGIEKQLVEKIKEVHYIPIASGKLRRYFTLKNFLTPFFVVLGIVQATWRLFCLKPKIVFSKGGFVAFPVVVAAWVNRIPVLAHESDLSPGLATRMSYRFVNKVAVSFAYTQRYFPSGTTLVTGTPIRPFLFSGAPHRAREKLSFDAEKPVLLIMGGGLGSARINETVYQALPVLLKRYQIIHLCGQGKLNKQFEHQRGYIQFEYVHEELADYFALAHIVISRSGANALAELVALKKSHILIPLGTEYSRGDQIENARYYEKEGISIVLPEKTLNVETLLLSLTQLEEKIPSILEKMHQLSGNQSQELICALLTNMAQKVDSAKKR